MWKQKEDAKRKKRARRGKNSEVSSSTHEQDDEQADVYKVTLLFLCLHFR